MNALLALILATATCSLPCGTIDGQQAACYLIAGEPQCCSNGLCLPAGSGTPEPTPVPTAVPTPVGSGPPEPFDAYAASCPEVANVVDGANGIVEINCPDVQIDCSQLAGGVIRVLRITPMMTWFMSNQVPRSYAGLITARGGGCSIRPLEDGQNLGVGEGGVITSCFYEGGCAPIPLSPFVPLPVVWETTDVFPETVHNQLFGVLPGR